MQMSVAVKPQRSIIISERELKIKPIIQNNQYITWTFETNSDVLLFKHAMHGDVIRSNEFIINRCKFYLELTPNGWGNLHKRAMVWCALKELPKEYIAALVQFKYKCDEISFGGSKNQILTTQDRLPTRVTNIGYSMSVDNSMLPQRFALLNSFRFECTVNVVALYTINDLQNNIMVVQKGNQYNVVQSNRSLRIMPVKKNGNAVEMCFCEKTDIQLFKNAKHGEIIRSDYFTINGCELCLEITPKGWGAFTGTIVWCSVYKLPKHVVSIALNFKSKCDSVSFEGEKLRLLTTQALSSINNKEYSTAFDKPIEYQRFANLNSFIFECEIKIAAFYDKNGHTIQIGMNKPMVLSVQSHESNSKYEWPDPKTWKGPQQTAKRKVFGDKVMTLYYITDPRSAEAICKEHKMIHAEKIMQFAETVEAAQYKAKYYGALITAKVFIGKEYVVKDSNTVHFTFEKLQKMGYDSVHVISGEPERIVYSLDQVCVINTIPYDKNQYDVFDAQFNRDKYFLLSDDMVTATFSKTGLPGVHDYQTYPACRVSCPISTSDTRSQSISFKLFQYGWFGIGSDTVKPHGFPGYTKSGWMIRITDGVSWYNNIKNAAGYNSTGDLTGEAITMKYSPNVKQLTVITEDGNEYIYTHKDMPQSGKAYFVFSTNAGKVKILHVAIKKYSAISEISVESNIKCVCGSHLMKLYANQYPKLNEYRHLKLIDIYCNVCYKEFKKDEIVFHCPLRQPNIHPDGYDICAHCSTKDIELCSNDSLLILRKLGFETRACINALNINNNDLKKAMKLLSDQEQKQHNKDILNYALSETKNSIASNKNNLDCNIDYESVDGNQGSNIMTELDEIMTQSISQLTFHDSHFRSFENYLLGNTVNTNNENMIMNESDIMYYLAGDDSNTSTSTNNGNTKNQTNNDTPQYNESSNTTECSSRSGGNGNGQGDRDNDDEKKDNGQHNNTDDEDEDEDDEVEDDEEEEDQEEETISSLNPHAHKFVPQKRWCSVPNVSTLPSIAEHTATNSVPNVSTFSMNRNINVNNIISLNSNQCCDNCRVLQISMDQKDLYMMHLLRKLNQKENEIQQLKMLLCQQSYSNSNTPHPATNISDHMQPKTKQAAKCNHGRKNKDHLKPRRNLTTQLSNLYEPKTPTLPKSQRDNETLSETIAISSDSATFSYDGAKFSTEESDTFISESVTSDSDCSLTKQLSNDIIVDRNIVANAYYSLTTIRSNVESWKSSASRVHPLPTANIQDEKCSINRPTQSMKNVSFQEHKDVDNKDFFVTASVSVICSKKLTTKVMPATIAEIIVNPEDYMQKHIKIYGENALIETNDGQHAIIDFKFHCVKTKQSLYAIAEKKKHKEKGVQWKLTHNLWSSFEVETEFNVSINLLKTQLTCAQNVVFKDKLNKIKNMLQNQKHLNRITTCKYVKWEKVSIHSKQSAAPLCLTVTNTDFSRRLQKFVKNANTINLVPIVTFTQDRFKYRIEITWIVDIGHGSIGIGLHLQNSKLIVTGIHLDIYDQHLLVPYEHECNCLECFGCTIDDLTILTNLHRSKSKSDLIRENQLLQSKLKRLYGNDTKCLNKINSTLEQSCIQKLRERLFQKQDQF